MQHKSRKQLRTEAASAQAELALLKSPEGLAAYLFEKHEDPEFTEAASAQAELALLKSPEGLAAYLFEKHEDPEFTEAVAIAIRALEENAMAELRTQQAPEGAEASGEPASGETASGETAASGEPRVAEHTLQNMMADITANSVYGDGSEGEITSPDLSKP